jgi:hypothetical protein
MKTFVNSNTTRGEQKKKLQVLYKAIFPEVDHKSFLSLPGYEKPNDYEYQCQRVASDMNKSHHLLLFHRYRIFMPQS